MVKEEDIKPFAEKIHAESLRMTRLIEDIIDLTKLDNGGTKMKWENCDFYRIVENTVDTVETAASVMDISFTLSGETAPVTAIPQLLYSIAYNLCENAIKYNHRGGSVSISVSQGERCTVLTVRDTGVGIPEEEQERIFERFYRVDKSRSKEAGGTGLGLSIARRTILLHKGTIKVESIDYFYDCFLGGPTAKLKGPDYKKDGTISKRQTNTPVYLQNVKVINGKNIQK